jgi:hypothetical protein
VIAIAMRVPMVNHWGKIGQTHSFKYSSWKVSTSVGLVFDFINNGWFWSSQYPNTLANSTLIILFSKMLKFSKIISPKSKKYCDRE